MICKSLCAAILAASLPVAAFAQQSIDDGSQPLPQLRGYSTLNAETQLTSYRPGSSTIPSLVSSPTAVYDNLGSPSTLDRVFSSLDVEATWGDQITLADTGRLDEMSLAFFNSTDGGANSSPLTTADLEVVYFDNSDPNAPTLPVLGGFNAALDFRDPNNPLDSGLPVGFYQIFNLTGLSGAEVDLLSPDVLFLYQLTNVTGGTSRLGVLDFSTTNIGSADDTLYIDDTDQTGGQAGFYNITDPDGNGNQVASPFYLAASITVDAPPVPEPATLGLLSIGGLALVRRRR